MERLADSSARHWLDTFFSFCVSNRPFLLPSTSTDTWEARREWVSEDGFPDTDALLSKYGVFLGSNRNRTVTKSLKTKYVLVLVIRE